MICWERRTDTVAILIKSSIDHFIDLGFAESSGSQARATDMGNGGENNRVRGMKRGNAYPLVMLLVFVSVVAVTTLISIHTPLEFNSADSKENLYAKFGTWKKNVQGVEEEKHADPYSPMIPDEYSSSGWSRSWVKRLPGKAKEEAFYCERSHIRSNVCHLHGIVQLVGNDSLVLNAVEKKTTLGEELIRPYTRKWEKPCMDKVTEITLRSQYNDRNTSMGCEVWWHKVPAVIFSTGGYTGNVYHEFNDGLIPLYITAQHLKRQVVFVAVDYHDWWVVKYQEIIKMLSKYEVIDIANYTKAHCFSDVTVGLYIHDELGIDQSLMPNHESIQDFRALLWKAYPLEVDSDWEKDFPAYGSSVQEENIETGAVPQLVIISRNGSRAIINLDKVIELATRMGFNVTVLQPDPTTEMKKIFWLLDRCDVLIGVHGAALTHFLFMRPGTVFIQIVPLGTDWAAKTYYGEPAKKLGLQYIEYKIAVEESTLSREYEKTNPILVNPMAIGQKGWSTIKEIYLGKQQVDLSLPRFYNVLEKAKAKWIEIKGPYRGRYPHDGHGSPPSEGHESIESS